MASGVTQKLLITVFLFLASTLAIAKPDDGGTKNTLTEGPRIVSAANLDIGRLTPDFSFTPVNGKSFRLSQLKPKKAIVIAFTSTSCPVANRYVSTLAAIEKQFDSQNVNFVFVNPVETDSLDSVNKAIREHGLRGPYVRDSEGRLAKALGARSTTEVFVLDAAHTLIYRGAVDDQYGLGYSKDAPQNSYLLAALKAVIAGDSPTISATTAPGCALTHAGSRRESEALTYYARISRILQSHCTECHHTDGPAPFSLETYRDVVSHAGMMRKQIERGAMPPWFAASQSENPHRWANDRTLPAQDKSDLIAWLSGTHAQGDPADAPLPRNYSKDWQIGAPDAVIRISEAIHVKATGKMPYQNVFVSTGFKEDRWVNAVEIRPTARDVVHHVLVFVLPAGTDESRQKRRDAEGGNFFAVYVPGNNVLKFPDGFAKLIPAGAKLHFQIHYTPKGTATRDQTAIGLRFTKTPPLHEVRVAAIPAKLDIPPEDPNYVAHGFLPVPFDAKLMSFMPHMHVRGKSYRYELKRPDGKVERLLDVPHYDFNWQLQYCLADFVDAPAGSTLLGTACYDNSTNNPANPNPQQRVRWGQQTDDEMMLGYLEYYIPGIPATGAQPSLVEAALRDGGFIFNGLDKNHNGVITIDESPSAAQFRLADADHDGEVTRDEFKNYWQRQREKRRAGNVN